jgi:glycosyltransferase involved in cell wall biosynthesis
VTSLGGVEAFQYDLAAELSKLGVEFRALNLKPRYDGIRQLPSWAVDYRPSRWLRGPLNGIRRRRMMRQFSPDFFLVHQPSSLNYLMSILPDRRWPVLSIVHNNSARQQYWRSQVRWQNNISGYVAVSEWIRRRLVEEFGIDGGRVWTIRCGINTEKTYPQHRVLAPVGGKQLVLLYAGRLATYAKQVLDLVGVVEALNKSDLPTGWEITLHVVGDGPEAEILRRKLYDIAGRVRLNWHGRIPREELFRIYEQSHFILLLSSLEGMPIALREAMSRGAVPVVTDIAAHREIITPGINGFLFPVGDVAGCAKLCCSLALSDGYEQVSRNAALWTQDQSIESTAAKYAELFEQLSRPAFSASERARAQRAWANKMPVA